MDTTDLRAKDHRCAGTSVSRPRNPNARRTPPAESLSVPPRIKQELLHENADHVHTQDPSKQKSNLAHEDTRDSNGSDESAGRWFDKANKHGPQGQRESPSVDGEPPFFLSNQKQYFPNNFVSSGSDDEAFGGENKNDSENDDLRGVIDDLTVENKRLKMLLKSTRSRSSPSKSESQAQDRLFDLRVHGLSANKKRELENLLRNFATSIPTTDATPMSSATNGSGQIRTTSEGSSSSMPQKPRVKSSLPPTDSGYGSNSASGLVAGQTPRIGSFPSDESKKSRTKTIHSYLHDIPDTLLPRQSLYMSKRAKMALVVRRLENLFTGRVAAPGEHSQPLQQQEVSRSAAYADDPTHRHGRAEGSREAHMLPQDTNLDVFDRQNVSPPTKKLKLRQELSGDSDVPSAVPSRPGSPGDQRPTRPLDLDIHRAQVADENIQYLRHLGMSSPQVAVSADKHDPQSRWVYLNLLISMAQLHTINVTPSFIRQAIKKLSTKFELSEDGHKVRWCGGAEGTTFTKEEEQAMHYVDPSPAESNDDVGGTSSKRSKTGSSSNALASEEPSSADKTSALQTSDASRHRISTAATSNLQTEQSRRTMVTGTPFDYKPMVYKGKRYSPAISYLESSASSHSNGNDSSGLVHALSNSNLNRRNSDDGMITFYQNPYFCTDLSADNAPTNWVTQRRALSWDTLGLPRDFVGESPLRHHDACYFTPQFAPQPYRPAMDEKVLNCNLEPIQSGGEDETVPSDFVVCGIGGVVPEENFALDVTILRKPASSGQKQMTYHVPFTGTLKRKRFEYEVDDCDKLDLQPSKLPPPSYGFFTSSSSSTDHDLLGSDSDETSSEAEEGGGINPPLPAFLNEDSSDDGSSDDMLAAARLVDPNRVAAEERQFLLNQNAARRVEGSLAATVGASHTASSGAGNDAQDERASVSSMDVDGSESSDGE